MLSWELTITRLVSALNILYSSIHEVYDTFQTVGVLELI